VGNTPMLANWVQIEMGMTLETIKVIHIFYVVETCSKFGF
jgi:hypothetical protein